MRILVIATATPVVSVALLTSKHIVGLTSWDSTRQLGHELLREIDALLQQAQWTVTDLDRIAVHGGPGHYSALRTGIITATTVATLHALPLVLLTSKEKEALWHEARHAAAVTTVTPQYAR